MKNNEFIDLCVSKLVEYVNSNLDKSDDLINITKDIILDMTGITYIIKKYTKEIRWNVL